MLRWKLLVRFKQTALVFVFEAQQVKKQTCHNHLLTWNYWTKTAMNIILLTIKHAFNRSDISNDMTPVIFFVYKQIHLELGSLEVRVDGLARQVGRVPSVCSE